MSLVDPLPQSPTVCHDGLDGLHGISPKLDTGRRRKKKKISPVALWSSRREREQQASKSVRSWKLDTKRDGLSTTLPALGLGLSGDRRPATVQPGSGQRTRQRRMRHDVRRRRSPKKGSREARSVRVHGTPKSTTRRRGVGKDPFRGNTRRRRRRRSFLLFR